MDEVLAIAMEEWTVIRRAQLAEQDRESEALTELHATQGGQTNEEMLGLVPALRGLVSAMRIVLDEHDKYVATYNVSVADFKSLGHAVRRSHCNFLDEDCCSKHAPIMHAECQPVGSFSQKDHASL